MDYRRNCTEGELVKVRRIRQRREHQSLLPCPVPPQDDDDASAEEAKQMLEAGDASIESIAYEVGYRDATS